MKGRSLQSSVKLFQLSGRLSFDKYFVHTLFYAFRHMHDNNVLHRDLKTANIFLTKENMVKVGDFGISKVN